MSTPAKGNPSPTISKKSAFKFEIKINDKTYREDGQHIIYCLSKVSHSSVDSLVDRGANSGVDGNDARVTAKHPDRTVGVRGIYNH